MTAKDLVALGDTPHIHNQTADRRTEFTLDHLFVLANFCESDVPDCSRKRVDRLHCRRGRQGDKLIVVEPDNTVIPGAFLGRNGLAALTAILQRR